MAIIRSAAGPRPAEARDYRPGGGSASVICFPAVRAGLPFAAVERPPRPLPAPLTVLLVERDAMVRTMLAEALEERGHRVIACRTGEECLRALVDASGRLLLFTDTSLPRWPGRALADAFRRICPGRPVVFTIGVADAEQPPLWLNEAVLFKPFGVSAMVTTVERIATAC